MPIPRTSICSQIDQVEFVRGPQSALFGRNALGGVINVTSRRPSVGGDWRGNVAVPFGNSGERGFRGAASGPVIGNKLGAGVAFVYGERDGFTTNVLTGNDIDYRSSYSGKAQLLWTPASNLEARLIVSGERDRDGDYGLSDLGGLRTNPFQTPATSKASPSATSCRQRCSRAGRARVWCSRQRPGS